MLGEDGELTAGAVPAGALDTRFPSLDLSLVPPLPPMEARLSDRIPTGEGWLYEPKWDGFRCLAWRSGTTVVLQSKAGQSLGRYFPEMLEALAQLAPGRFVLDGELVIAVDGAPSFDDLLQRIHPAESRVRRLARERPATLLAFDLLVDDRGASLVGLPLEERRVRLEAFFAHLAGARHLTLSPATRAREVAERWMRDLTASGLDGVVAKRLDAPYLAGERTAMVKVKPIRTADCVVGGFRRDRAGREVASLLLGLYDDEGLLDHVGFAASFTASERRALRPVLEPLVEPPGFTGSAPGGPSRWSRDRSTAWEPLRPSLVCEVRYDTFSGGRFRHGTRFLRWRPDKSARACTFDQVRGRRVPLEGLGLPAAS